MSIIMHPAGNFFVLQEEDEAKIATWGIPIAHRRSVYLRRTHIHQAGES